MKKQLSIQDRQEVLIAVLKEGLAKHGPGWAVFGIGKEVVKPLIAQGLIHADTYKFTGGATLTKEARG